MECSSPEIQPVQASQRNAFLVVVSFGIVSLLADITYEGARSLLGPLFYHLGASSFAVGFVAGAGELLGYGIRLLSGFLIQRTRKLWGFLFLGYTLNLFAVPLLGWARSWEVAALLAMGERLGKGIRTPARDTLLSRAAQGIGSGLGFGLHEALDSIGALLGPVAMGVLLLTGSGYRTPFFFLAIPAFLALVFLFLAYRTSRALEALPPPQPLSTPLISGKEDLPSSFWLLCTAAACLAFATLDYPLIAYHFERKGLYRGAMIPFLYGGVMGGIALLSPALGIALDRRKTTLLCILLLLTLPFPILILSPYAPGAGAGLLLYTLALSFQGGLLSAMVAITVPAHKRAGAYGIFHSIFGFSWFAGSSLMGYLYRIAPEFAMVGASLPYLAGVLLFLLVLKRVGETSGQGGTRLPE